jgi:hypothetical protein
MKEYYRITIVILKYIPIIFLFVSLLNLVNVALNVHVLGYLNDLVGIAIVPVVFFLICSFLFRFCYYHKMLLGYSLIVGIITLLDKIFVFSIFVLNSIIYFLLFLGISLLIYVFFNYERSKKCDR